MLPQSGLLTKRQLEKEESDAAAKRTVNETPVGGISARTQSQRSQRILCMHLCEMDFLTRDLS